MRRILGLSLLTLACQEKAAPPTTATTPKPVSKPAREGVPRSDWNRIAQELDLPFFWSEDTDGDGAVDEAEVALLWGMSRSGEFEFEALDQVHEEIAKIHREGHPQAELAEREAQRRKLVLEELRQGRPTLVAHDFSADGDQDKAIVERIIKAAALIEDLHAKQLGTFSLRPELAALDHPASRALFLRNQGPWCEAPGTESNPDCSALPSFPEKLSGLYPASIQKPGFCEALAKDKEGAQWLADHFSVIVENDGKHQNVPYPVAYKDEMEAIAAQLDAAAIAIRKVEEAPFQEYLRAAAKAFRTNDWPSADEAWSKMNVNNSRWYLRIAPDEVYFEPCGVKAGFHVSFGLIDKGSLKWQSTLEPVKQEMEDVLAKLAGLPYKARKVDFHLPDFVDIVLNAGDSRSAHGATIGQSLPNWGPVANEGRGRTVAMTGFYTDPDSRADQETQAKSLFCAQTMKHYTTDPAPQLMSTVLHEAAHNLGPAHEYKVGGKTASQVFGGPLASTMEELKAQTAALFFTDWLSSKGLVSDEERKRAHVRDLFWSFGHISRGMYTQDNKPKSYSQLAAIQLRHFLSESAVTWKAEEKAANGTDVGCFEVDHEKLPGSIESLMLRVARIKGRGDKKDAEALVARFVDADDEGKRLMEVITERVLRAPKASFVYSVKY